ncbi:hypothetical protein Hanom_Chr11g01049681 [Helianthus anomalus]
MGILFKFLYASGPSYTQPELSLSHFPQYGQTMPLFPQSDLSMQTRHIRGTTRRPLLGMT